MTCPLQNLSIFNFFISFKVFLLAFILLINISKSQIDEANVIYEKIRESMRICIFFKVLLGYIMKNVMESNPINHRKICTAFDLYISKKSRSLFCTKYAFLKITSLSLFISLDFSVKRGPYPANCAAFFAHQTL